MKKNSMETGNASRWGTLLLAFILCFAWHHGHCAEYKLQASDGQDNDDFGCSVGIDNDIVVVGSRDHIVYGEECGAAYIFEFDGSQWIEQQRIMAVGAETNDNFGCSVASDGYEIFVGANYDRDNDYRYGAVCVFRKTWGRWLQRAELRAGDGDGLFGSSVAIDGEILIIGAPDRFGHYPTRSGEAYIFQSDSGFWAEQQKITASDGEYGNQFGFSVAIDGDDAIVGAPQSHYAALYPGAAYILINDGSQWIEHQKLVAADGYEGDRFGVSVALSGDRAIIGAPQYVLSGSGPGAAYYFINDGSQWIEQQKITASDGDVGDKFGNSVSINGEYAVIGASRDSDNGAASGAVYVFRYNGIQWMEQQKITPSDGAAYDTFGCSVASNSGNVIVGAYGHDSAYVYSDIVAPTPTPLPATPSMDSGCISLLILVFSFLVLGVGRRDNP